MHVDYYLKFVMQIFKCELPATFLDAIANEFNEIAAHFRERLVKIMSMPMSSKLPVINLILKKPLPSKV